LGKGVIQGVSQYISKRMRTVKITLKAGHRVLLHSPEK
ncbi:conjugative transposon protein TraM, partial [Phocaeicola dorei]